jgi:hypothetical protein
VVAFRQQLKSMERFDGAELRLAAEIPKPGRFLIRQRLTTSGLD